MKLVKRIKRYNLEVEVSRDEMVKAVTERIEAKLNDEEFNKQESTITISDLYN